MKTKKLFTLLAVATLATAVTSGSSAAFAENSVTGTEPAVTAPVEQPITVSVAHVHYGVGYIGYWDYTINPGETITVPAKDIPGTRPDVSQLTISYEQAKTQTQYTIVYYTVDSPTTVAPPPVITTEEPAPPVATTVEPPVATTVAPPVVTTAEPPVVTTTQEQPATTQATTEPVVTTTNNGGGGAQNTTQEPKTTVQAPKSGDKPKVNQPKTDAPKKDQPKVEPKAEAPAKQTVKPKVAKTAADTAASGLTNNKSSVVGYLAAMLMAVVGFVLLLGYNPKEEK